MSPGNITRAWDCFYTLNRDFLYFVVLSSQRGYHTILWTNIIVLNQWNTNAEVPVCRMSICLILFVFLSSPHTSSPKQYMRYKKIRSPQQDAFVRGTNKRNRRILGEIAIRGKTLCRMLHSKWRYSNKCFCRKFFFVENGTRGWKNEPVISNATIHYKIWMKGSWMGERFIKKSCLVSVLWITQLRLERLMLKGDVDEICLEWKLKVNRKVI